MKTFVPCFKTERDGRVAQLAEHLLCKQGVGGSSPPTSTNPFGRNLMEPSSCRDTISLLLSNLPRDYRTLVMNDSSSVKKIKKRDQVGSV